MGTSRGGLRRGTASWSRIMDYLASRRCPKPVTPPSGRGVFSVQSVIIAPVTIFSFQLIEKDKSTGARAGVMRTPHGEVPTPVFMPVGTQATVKT
ncbi:MAG: hypothetical protein M0T85_15900, partial [Dehalococcoidales bacterium]|nr:hypothetical protein [Dehalococcoidales bacterium]